MTRFFAFQKEPSKETKKNKHGFDNIKKMMFIISSSSICWHALTFIREKIYVINVWKDNGLPGSTQFTLFVDKSDAFHYTKVAHILNPENRDCDNCVIELMFVQVDYERIKSIKILEC